MLKNYIGQFISAIAEKRPALLNMSSFMTLISTVFFNGHLPPRSYESANTSANVSRETSSDQSNPYLLTSLPHKHHMCCSIEKQIHKIKVVVEMSLGEKCNSFFIKKVFPVILKKNIAPSINVSYQKG